MDYEKKCLLKMTHDALIIANSGQPFSRLGVISICASHRGTKRKAQPIDLFSEWMDSDLPKAIREKEIETYLWDKNRLLDDYNQEREVSFDYGGRFLWELLQNADDAMCPIDTPPSDLIGIKGLGFKSVLEITNKPAIYSDPFHFYFSATDSQKFLQERGINEPPPLAFRIPHDNHNIEDILDLVDEYPTIISLPFKDKIAQKKVERELNNLSVFFLLLSQYIKSVEVVWPDGRNRLWRIKRDSDGELKDGDIYVEVIEDELVQDTHRFRRWAHIWSPEGAGKRHSVVSCLPLSSTGEVQAWEETFPLYSFFPTEEFLPFRALFHASFDLDQSRKHVRNPDNEDILGHLEMLLGRIVAAVPAEISLKAFFPKDEPNENTIAYTLWELFKSVLRQKEFVSCIGGKKVKPPKARLWEYNLGNVLRPYETKVMEKSLVEPKLLRDSDLRKALVHLGAEPLEDAMYLTLLRYCKNENRDDCQKAFKAFFVIIKELVKYFPYQKDKYYLNICRKIPCWWIADGSARSLFNQLPFLRREPELSLPNWLQFDALDHEFLVYLNEIESKDNNDPPQIWNKILSGRLLNDKRDELLNHFLVPTIEAKKEKDWWEQHGGEALHVYQLWTKGLKFKGSPVAIWNDNNREGIGNSLFLPTDKGWLPSWQCYAGKSWGAPESFDTFFSNITDRGVLKEPDQWPVDIEENKDHWKNILRYAGVSWEMKLIYKSVPDDKGWEIRRQSVSWWTKCPFPPSLIQEEDWSEYLSSLVPPDFNRRTQFDWDTKIHEQWGIEFFPDALPKNPTDRLKVIKPIAKEAKNNRMKYSFQKGAGWPGRNTGQVKSFASWQIEDFSWLLCKPSLLDNRLTVPPDKAYMPGKGIGGLLPEINIKIPEGQEGRDLVTFLTQILGVRETLPLSGELIWKEWIEKLPSAAQRTMDHDVAIRATRMVYRSFFDIHDEKPEWLDETYDIPCLKWDKDGKSEQLGFNSSSDIYWLDKPYLAEPNTRIELLHRFNIFILEQEQGKEAAVWCEIKPLSTIVHVEPHFDSINHDTTNIIQKRYDERYNSLKVVSGLANLPNPEKLKILAVDNLRLKIIKEGQIISAPTVRNWKENGLILLDRSKKWEALGLALAQKQTQKDISSTFEILLGARDGAEVLQRLRDRGVPEAAIEDLESDFQEAVIPDTKEFNNQTKEDVLTEDQSDSQGTNTHYKFEPTKESSISDKATSEPEKKQTRDTAPSSTVSQSRRKKGEDAESWIRSRISDLLSIPDWAVSSQSERDHLNRESDVVLSHPTFGKYHIEVKHVEAGEIFWSEREVSKAKDHKDKYWMVVARPGYAENDRNIIWFWNPLEDFRNLPRRGKWFWRTETEATEIAITDWDVPTPRKREDATYFTFVIKVNNEFLDNFRLNTSRGLMCLTEKLPESEGT